MLELVRLAQATLVAALRSRRRLAVENLLLRQQLQVALRCQRRPRLRARDKLFWLAVRRLQRDWRRHLFLVRPETVLGWHHRGWRLFWRWRSGHALGRPRLKAAVRELIATMGGRTMSFDPSALSQLNYPVNATVTNISGQAWNGATLRSRWYLAGSTTSLSDGADVASLGLAAGQTQTTQVNVSPPTLPAGMDAARFTLRFDLVDSSGLTPAFFADKGNPPLDNPVIVNKVLRANIGLEHFWQFTSQPVGGA